MAVTIKDVAVRAGVSLITVSRVVNGVGAVSTETRAKVVAAIAELRYVPNRAASSLRSRQTYTLALLLPTIAGSFWTTIARGAEDEAEARGYSLFLCNTDEVPDKEARYIDAILRNQVAGVLIVPVESSSSRLHRLIERQMPFVQVQHRFEDIAADAVRSDGYHGAMALTQDLVDAGHQRIAYIGVFETLSTGRDRLRGYRDVLAAAGITADPALIRLGHATREAGAALADELIQTHADFDALVIGNSAMAVSALRTLINVGKRVPDDLAIATYYDSAALDDFSQYMTAVIQPAYEIGKLSVQCLFDRIAGSTAPIQDIVLPNRVVPFTRNMSFAPKASVLSLRLSLTTPM